MRYFVLAIACLILLSTAATVAQEPPKPDPFEVALAQQWQAAQTGQQNVADAIGKLVDAYRKEKARADVAEAKLKDKDTK